VSPVTYKAEVGRVVLSKAGRDTGRAFMILSIIDDSYVYIVDGDLRKTDRPKRKKLKHLKLTEHVLETIAGKLKKDEKVFDAEIRSALKALCEQGQ